MDNWPSFYVWDIFLLNQSCQNSVFTWNKIIWNQTIWSRTTQIAREETHCHHYMGCSFQLAARNFLYAPSHSQDSTYQLNMLWNTTGTRYSSVGSPWRIDPMINHTTSSCTLWFKTSQYNFNFMFWECAGFFVVFCCFLIKEYLNVLVNLVEIVLFEGLPCNFKINPNL